MTKKCKNNIFTFYLKNYNVVKCDLTHKSRGKLKKYNLLKICYCFQK